MGTIRTCVSRRGAQWLDEAQEHIGIEVAEPRNSMYVCLQAVSPEEQDEAVSG